MKIMKTFLMKIVALITVLTAGLSFATPALAAGSFNPDPEGLGVGILSVAISPTNHMGDYSTINAQPGDVVSVNIYYHNNGNAPITNTRMRISPASTGSGTSHTFTGTLSGDNAATITDTVSVHLSSAQTLTFIPGSVRWFPNQSGVNGPGSGLSLSSSQEAALVGGSGFSIGTLNTGWASQGGIVAKFQVSNATQPSQGQKPSVTTYSPTGLSDTTGSATLKGFVDPKGASTTTWFQYRRTGGAWTDTTHQSVGTTAQNILKGITNLSAGDYEYQIVAENQYGTAYGESKYFTINGGTGPCTTCDCTGGCGNNDLPTVVTNSATDVSDTYGSAILRGTVTANASSASAWFKYRRNGGSWTETVHQYVGSNTTNIAKGLTGLSDGSYEFQAVAQNSNGTAHGESKYFTINNNDGCDTCSCDDSCGNDNPSVETLSPTNVDENSATLRGKLTDDGNDENDVYFKWGTRSSNLNHTLDAGSRSSTGTFSKNLSGLDANETYYYRACADNSSGTDCGDVESFDTDSNNYCDNDCCDSDCNGNDRPDVTTLAATSIGSTVAVINGYYDSNGCSTTTYFQYGRTNSLGNTVGSVSHYGSSSGGMAYVFSALSPNTTYYYRAVGVNCEGTTYGVIRSFTTNTRTVVVDTTPVVTITGGGTGNAFIKLMIDNHRGTVRSGSDIPYDVSWENITGTTLHNLVLEVNFDSMTVIDTDMGSISHDASSVFIEIDSLAGHETGEATIVTQTKGFLKDGDPVVGQAIMAFENPKTSATENAIAYDSDEFTSRGSVLGASIFGLNLPTTLGGWLIIILIILLIIVLARHFMRQNQNHVIVNQASAPHPVDVAPSPATGNDYIVYRPTPPIK